MGKLKIVKSLKDGFESVRTNPKLILVTLVYLGIITGLISPILPFQNPDYIKNVNVLEIFPLFFGIILVTNLVSIFSTGLLIALVAKGKRFPLAAAIRFVMSRYPTLVLSSILLLAAVGLGFLIFGVGGILLLGATGLGGATPFLFLIIFPVMVFASLKFIYIYPTIVLDNKGAVESLKSSWRITGGNLRGLLGMVILITVISVIIELPVIISQLLGNLIIASILNIIVSLFLTPWTMATITHSYLQLRKR